MIEYVLTWMVFRAMLDAYGYDGAFEEAGGYTRMVVVVAK